MPDFSSQIYKAIVIDGNPLRSEQLFQRFLRNWEKSTNLELAESTECRDAELVHPPGLKSAAAEVIVSSKATNEPSRSSRVCNHVPDAKHVRAPRAPRAKAHTPIPPRIGTETAVTLQTQVRLVPSVL